MGIDADLLPRVFDLFTQAERLLDRAQGGLGIGLSLVKNLVELHGGQVNATSPGAGRGSTFAVRLPLIAAPTARVGAPSKAAPVCAKRVLVVEDNVDAAHSVGTVLELAGHSVAYAHDGAAGLKAATDFCPNVCVVDIGLPGMSGYELVAQLRQLPESEEMVFLALTGYGSERDRALAKDAGFHHHFTKPVEPQALLDIVGGT